MAPENDMPEPPAPLTAKTIVRADFPQVRKGFDPDTVLAHLGRTAEHVADLESTIADLQTQLRERERSAPNDEAARNRAYESTAARIADLVRTFDQDVQRLRAEHEAQATARLADAQATAERTEAEAADRRARAEAEAERIVREASEEAARVRAEADRAAEEALAGLQSRREELLESVRRLREGLTHTAESVDGVLRGADEVRVDAAAEEGEPAAARPHPLQPF
jgi:chromosome segregation ATPase